MKSQETYKHYLRDLIYLLKNRNEEFQNIQENDDFNEGVKFAYSSILQKIENQANSFKMKPEDFGFTDFENFKNKTL